MERVTGIEPAWPAWKAGALPLSYTRTCENLSAKQIYLVQIHDFKRESRADVTPFATIENH